jgi:hypothetical protein
MAFGCDPSYYNACSSGYNFYYRSCCSYAWTEFGVWMLWISLCGLCLVMMMMAARARQRRRQMYMEQMQQNQMGGGAVIIQTT